MAGTGLKKTTAGALAYIGLQVSGIIMLIVEKDPFVRFHAMQSIVVFTVLMVLHWAMLFIFFPLAGLIWILGVILYLVMIFKAWQGQEWEVPVLGKLARKFVKKV